ncbi:hypothetical protein LCGC14_2933850, partial [marine sediment metagenome]
SIPSKFIMENKLKFGFIECRLNCDSCGAPLHLNGPLESKICGRCQTEMQIPQDSILSILESMFKGWLENNWGPLESVRSTVWSTINYEITVSRQNPCCRSCKTEFPESEFQDRPGVDSWEMICKKCNRIMPVDRPPQWLKDKCNYIELIVNAEISEHESRLGKPAIEKVVFICPKCGNALDIDGLERIVHCINCNSNIYLPDDLWLRLHPEKITEMKAHR